jgi:carbohydrate kinase (thermoresistant glucokinase family)
MLILVMGVTGAGKTTIGVRLAARLGLPFYDADDYHPLENRMKMAADIALDDADRLPWLERLSECAIEWERAGGAVLACSALKRAYREILFRGVRDHRTVFLELTPDQAMPRLDSRRGQHEFIRDYDHVLAGQFADLERPEPAIHVSAVLPPDEIVELAARELFREGFVPPSA